MENSPTQPSVEVSADQNSDRRIAHGIAASGIAIAAGWAATRGISHESIDIGTNPNLSVAFGGVVGFISRRRADSLLASAEQINDDLQTRAHAADRALRADPKNFEPVPPERLPSTKRQERHERRMAIDRERKIKAGYRMQTLDRWNVDTERDLTPTGGLRREKLRYRQVGGGDMGTPEFFQRVEDSSHTKAEKGSLLKRGFRYEEARSEHDFRGTKLEEVAAGDDQKARKMRRKMDRKLAKAEKWANRE